MVDLEVLASRGIDYEGLKKKLSVDDKQAGVSAGVKRLRNMIRSRLHEGREFNVTNFKLYQALDAAWDMPFRGIDNTLLASLIDKAPDDPCVQQSLNAWKIKLESVVPGMSDPKTQGGVVPKLNLPAFFEIGVPLVRCYVTTRWAKIVNDRRSIPQFKYDPSISNEVNRARCDVVTARVKTMSEQMGYFDVEKQAIWRALHYGEQVMFPVEEWYSELQEVDSKYPAEGETTKDKNGRKIKKIIVKEGLRYHLPHPTRTFWDRAYLQHSINSDTGVMYGGHWRIMRWGDVHRNKKFYNTKKVGLGSGHDFCASNSAFLSSVYAGCPMEFPVYDEQNGKSKYDAETHIANSYYTTELDDKAVLITEYYQKLIPSEFDLGDYDHPVWFRFVVASDDSILYCVPLPACPMLYYGYDVAEGRTLNASMSLEVLPFQDQFQNLMTQFLIAVKQNLANVTFINQDVFEEEDIKKVENLGERQYRFINFIRTSFKNLVMGRNDPREAIISHKFPFQDTNNILNAMRIILDTLERVLVMSSQEVGQAATHEQTREEVRNIASSTGTRVIFTTTGMNVARDAWKRQLYYYLMAYGQESFWAQIPMEEMITSEQLEKLGFSYATDTPEESWDPRERKANIKANRHALLFTSFASDRDGEDRINSLESAKAMNEWFMGLMANPITSQSIGPEQAIKAANYIAKMAGFPRDFKLRAITSELVDQQRTQQMDEVQKIMEQMKQQMDQELKGALGAIMDENQSQSEQIGEIQTVLQQMLQPNAPRAEMPPPVDMMPPGVRNGAMPVPIEQQAMA